MNRRFFMGGQLFSSQAMQLFARMTTQPTMTRMRVIDQLIRDLLSAGVWDLLDAFYVVAAHNEQAARLNWKSASYTLGGAASFLADRGYTGDGSSAHLQTGYKPGDGQFGDAGHSFGVWTRTANLINAMTLGTSNGSFLCALQGTATMVAWSGATSSVVNGIDGINHAVVNRTSSSAFDAYSNGVFWQGRTLTPFVMSPTYEFYLLAINNQGVAQSPTAAQIGAAHFGANLSSGQIAALYAALADYMTAVGA